ncbi:MAG: type II toxin-antitoxin system RelE/ParE family toxin [Rhodoferax sp.]|nr:type II toxin-antitoxin system RelE/ParE family toxin [Rhodoferax sp.]
MAEIRIYADSQDRAPFVHWLDGLKDLHARAIVRARLEKVRAGNFGDCKLLRDGVQELRIDFGPGYRVYLSRQGRLSCCCSLGKYQGRPRARYQAREIDYLNDWKQRGKR